MTEKHKTIHIDELDMAVAIIVVVRQPSRLACDRIYHIQMKKMKNRAGDLF
jgi:hypothetical protein